MPRLYLAGPMTGIPDYNYPLFNAMAERLRAKGFEVENPAENQAPACGSWAGYMRLALSQLMTCEVVAFLPNWEASRGARLEYQVAKELGLKICLVDDLLNPAVCKEAA
ncbi:DUF4406 domain-containing protein [Methylomonas fluvii]|uniref:DUF4406 domain-containing protein n=1 Tax=Methylomonas fluvii TaxID=1854564 RepID=A0ABR9DIK1_9GAMM|nr:DUF4406 domain-containing protein [Methylomonas fluvii]MBD9362940.1 DUF4406 domain-containing protein [Methylomonas fluvii]CAD6876126.1 hypothetical protein [Methylomonas fluvii]